MEKRATNGRLGRLVPSPAMAVACVALAVALSGVGYAAVVLPRNSVGTPQLKKNAVKSAKIAPNTIVGADVNEATLSIVPSAANAQAAVNAENATNAQNAANATNAQNATNADRLDNLDSADFARSASEAWRSVGTAGQPPFNGPCSLANQLQWINYLHGTTPYNEVAFYKDPVGVVHLRGLASQWCAGSDGANTTIFTLPAGYRPAEIEVVATLSNNTVNRINVHPNGDVTPGLAVGSTSTAWISLDGITFRAAN